MIDFILPYAPLFSAFGSIFGTTVALWLALRKTPPKVYLRRMVHGRASLHNKENYEVMILSATVVSRFANIRIEKSELDFANSIKPNGQIHIGTILEGFKSNLFVKRTLVIEYFDGTCNKFKL